MPITTMTPVKSSNLAAVGYDPESEMLRVQFHSGAVWEYSQVSPAKYSALIHAPSVGGYYSTFIKGKHDGVLVESKPPAKTDAMLREDLERTIKEANTFTQAELEATAARHVRGEVLNPELKPIVDAVNAAIGESLLNAPKVPWNDLPDEMIRKPDAIQSPRYVPPVLEGLGKPVAPEYAGNMVCPRCLGLSPHGCPECDGIGSVSR